MGEHTRHELSGMAQEFIRSVTAIQDGKTTMYIGGPGGICGAVKLEPDMPVSIELIIDEHDAADCDCDECRAGRGR